MGEGGGQPVTPQAVREVAKALDQPSAHNAKASKGELAMGVLLGLASLGAVIFAGFNRYHLNEVIDHSNTAAQNPVERDTEQPYVPQIQRHGLPLGTIKINVVTTIEREDLNPESIRFVDFKGNREYPELCV